MANQFSEQAASRIEDICHKQGMSSGYDALQKEYDSFKASHNATDTATFWAQVQDKLQRDKVLPDLAVAWADKHRNDLSRDGELTRFDLNQVHRNRDATDLDKGMAKSLTDSFDKLKFEHADKEKTTFGFGGQEKDAITGGDIADHMRKVEAQRKASVEAERNMIDARNTVAPLFKSTDGNPNHTLFKTIEALRGGPSTNSIDASDLKRYLDEYKVREQHGDLGKHFTPENKKVVENLLKDWNTDATARLRSPSTLGITPESAAKAAGFKDAKDMVAANTVKPEEKKENPPAPPEKEKEKGKHPPENGKHPPENSAWNDMQRKALKSLDSELRQFGDRVVQPGDTLWSIARANLQIDSGKSQVSGKEIIDEMKRIKRLNGIDENANWMLKPKALIKVREDICD